MLKFDFLEKGLGIVSHDIFCMIFFQEKLFSCYVFLRYWAMYILHLFVNQVVTSYILELT